jgi:hypothetical protein
VLNGSFGASAGVAQRDRVTIALTDALAPIVASSVVPLPLTPSA